MHIVVHHSLAEINSQQWNALLDDDNPFMRHEFLSGLESCACVCPDTGWQPCHIAVWQDQTQTQLLGAMPCYIKEHSYGEYIFDWAWADAHQRNGLPYYPKLSNAIPFTPATGPRWLVDSRHNSTEISDALIQKALQIVEQQQLSSFHSLFVNKPQFDCLNDKGFAMRHSSQFHWLNKGYSDFAEFLAAMSSKKRKNIKRERRRIEESGIRYRWLTGPQLDQAAAQQMYQFYARTIAYYGAQSYLNKEFFNYIASSFSQHTLFLFAEYQDQVIAGGLYFKSNNTLYGRYWGALNNFHSVHFETCYYQAIEWCIKHGYQSFEAGAQGEHKLARGLEPTTTYSAHWISHPQFRDAIEDFLQHEQTHMAHYADALQSHSPFKAEV